MKTEIYSIDEIKGKLQPILERNKIKKAILFGSYAKGIATEYSDIDLFIDSNDGLSGLRFFGVVDEIAETFDISVDVIEARQVINILYSITLRFAENRISKPILSLFLL